MKVNPVMLQAYQDFNKKTFVIFEGFLLYSIAETAKANNLKPYNYIEYLLSEISHHMEDTGRSFLKDLLPWSPKIPDEIRIK